MNRRPEVVLANIPPDFVGQPPIGLGCVAQHLRDQGVVPHIVDVNVELSRALAEHPEGRTLWSRGQLPWIGRHYRERTRHLLAPHLGRLADRVADCRPGLVGMSAYSVGWSCAVDFAEAVRERCPDVVLVAGGAATSARANLRGLPRSGFDYLVVGLGENPLWSMLQALADGIRDPETLTRIPGVVAWAASPSDAPMESRWTTSGFQGCEQFSLPMFDGFDLSTYRGCTIPLLTSRGCARRCRFCDVPARSGRVHISSEEGLLDALEAHVGRGYRSFNFADAAMNGDVHHLGRLADGILERGLDVTWGGMFLARPGITAAFWDKLHRAGMSGVGVGVESLSDAVLALMAKGQTARGTMEMLTDARDAGVAAQGCFVAGFPGETEAMFQESLERLAELVGSGACDVCSITTCFLLPESTIGRDPARFGITLPDRWPAILWEGPHGNTYDVRLARLESIREVAQSLGGGRSLHRPDWFDPMVEPPDPWAAGAELASPQYVVLDLDSAPESSGQVGEVAPARAIEALAESGSDAETSRHEEAPLRAPEATALIEFLTARSQTPGSPRSGILLLEGRGIPLSAGETAECLVALGEGPLLLSTLPLAVPEPVVARRPGVVLIQRPSATRPSEVTGPDLEGLAGLLSHYVRRFASVDEENGVVFRRVLSALSDGPRSPLPGWRLEQFGALGAGFAATLARSATARPLQLLLFADEGTAVDSVTGRHLRLVQVAPTGGPRLALPLLRDLCAGLEAVLWPETPQEPAQRSGEHSVRQTRIP